MHIEYINGDAIRSCRCPTKRTLVDTSMVHPTTHVPLCQGFVHSLLSLSCRLSSMPTYMHIHMHTDRVEHYVQGTVREEFARQLF